MKAMERDSHIKDHELLLLSIKDPEVFAAIVRRYQSAFLRKALTLTRNEDDAQDLVQEAFVKIYLNAGKFERRANASFQSWGYKILLNTFLSHCKKRGREVPLEIDIAQEEEGDNLKDRFLNTLSKIPERSAQLLRRLVIDGKSHEELAHEEGIEEGTLRVRIHRAKQAFKRSLVEHPYL